MALTQGRLNEAVDLFERALQLKPRGPVLHRNLAETERRAGRPERAVEHAKRALELRPDHADALAILGGAHFDLGDDAEALKCYDLALALDPSQAGIHNKSRQRAAAVEPVE